MRFQPCANAGREQNASRTRDKGATRMLRYLAAASIFAVALPLASSPVIAQERVGDAALGALSGAVVLGPIGAVAGAVVGYTSGPSIAHSWGIHSSEPRPARSRTAATHAPKGNPAPLPKPRPNAAPSTGPSTVPSTAPSTAPSAKISTKTSDKPSTAPVQSAGGATMPPVQSLE